MLLSEIIKNIENKTLVNFKDVDIKYIEYDSRCVKENSIFVCIKGENFDGHDFIEQAAFCGACAVIYSNEEKFEKFKNNITGIKTNDTSKALALASLEFYHHPEKLIKIIGVTGTNGKTTTTILINEILKEAKIKTALIGTLYIEIEGKRLKTINTTPSSLDIIKTMADMVRQGIYYLIMEVSSHALEQNRVYGIPYDIAVFTNLSQDHLDYHKNMEDYFQAKLKLFKQMDMFKNSHRSPVAVLNIDDEKSSEIIKNTKAKIFTYGVKNDADLKAQNIKMDEHGISYTMVENNFIKDIKLNLLGSFNVYNSLAASASALNLGIDKDIIFKALEAASPVKGRFENIRVSLKGIEFNVIIDYAHTPDGLAKLLSSVIEISNGKIITVFGCGGDRDRTKRPIMGAIASEYSDIVIITSDNPRGEDSMRIIKEIEGGVKEKDKNYLIEEDREKAIEKALNSAVSGSFVVIAGKGHETYQIFKDKTIHFDDREIVEKILNDK